jgi:CRISPR-associated protein Cas1
MPIVPYLIADTFGTHIGKYSGRLKITQGKTVLQQAPLLHLQAVHVVSRGVSISSDAIAACVEQGIPIYFLDDYGGAYASLYASRLGATVLTRREQIRAYDDKRAIVLARGFVSGKLANQARLLRYMAGHRDEASAQHLNDTAHRITTYLPDIAAVQGEHIDAIRETLMGIEGTTARLYWGAVRELVPDTYGWEKRVGRGATDAVNSLLNYGYGILYSEVERALVLSGLDPYAGFLHTDRNGKPSLVLDAIEEFRQALVDRVVWGLVGRKFKVEQDDQGRMLEDTRTRYAEHILNAMDSKVLIEGQRHTFRHLLQGQMRAITSYLRNPDTTYQPFVTPLQ